MNLLWLLLVIPTDRFVGMGLVSRLISLPMASIVFGISLCAAIGMPWWMTLVYGALFAVGRGAAVGEGFKLITGDPLDTSRITWNTRWLYKAANLFPANNYLRAGVWAFLRISGYYLPLFIAVSPLYGVLGAIIFGLCWVACYGFVGPIWRLLKLPITENCYTNAAEWASCVSLAAILACLISI